MSKLLIVQESVIVRAAFKELLDECVVFNYDLISTYEEAKILLATRRYKYALVDRVLSDALHGEIIALCNKHHLAPLVFTKTIDEDFFDDFEGARIVDYIQHEKHYDESLAVEKLLQLRENSNNMVLVVSASSIEGHYIKQNLNLHNFRVVSAMSNEEANEKLELHPDISLVILDSNEAYIDNLKLIGHIRKIKTNAELKIIVLANESAAYSTSNFLKHGADDYLVKEYSRDEFYVRVYQNIKKVR